jgi:hypothetical protein
MQRYDNDTQCVAQPIGAVELGLKMNVDRQHTEHPGGNVFLAIVLEGVSEKWHMNVIQVLASPTSARMIVEGHGTVEPIAFSISQSQARHLAQQIKEILGPEHRCL